MMFFLHLGILSHREIHFLPEDCQQVWDPKRPRSISPLWLFAFQQETTHTFESF